MLKDRKKQRKSDSFDIIAAVLFLPMGIVNEILFVRFIPDFGLPDVSTIGEWLRMFRMVGYPAYIHFLLIGLVFVLPTLIISKILSMLVNRVRT